MCARTQEPLTGLPVEVGSGGLTKYNRFRQNLEKLHWLYASCVGKSTPEKLILRVCKPLKIISTGNSSRKRIIPDKYGNT